MISQVDFNVSGIITFIENLPIDPEEQYRVDSIVFEREVYLEIRNEKEIITDLVLNESFFSSIDLSLVDSLVKFDFTDHFNYKYVYNSRDVFSFLDLYKSGPKYFVHGFVSPTNDAVNKIREFVFFGTLQMI